jgi:hypothetical protein
MIKDILFSQDSRIPLNSFNLIGSIFWFLVGLGFAAGGFRYGFGTWKEPGPGLLPVVFGVLLGLLSLGLATVSLQGKIRGGRKAFWEEKGSWKPVLSVLISLLLYIAFFKFLGFILCTTLFILLLLRFLGRKGWLLSISLALVLALFGYGLFSILLGTPLPKGQLYGFAFRALAWV